MPIYELQCTKCLVVYEVLCKLEDINPRNIGIVCDECHAPLKRIMSSSCFMIDKAVDS